MITKEDWLPVGSVVRLKDGERPIMIAGYMAMDADKRKIWDYVGYPYPEGKMTSQDYFFDKDMIEEIRLVGYLDQRAVTFLSVLESNNEDYQAQKAEAAPDVSGDGTGAVSSSNVE